MSRLRTDMSPTASKLRQDIRAIVRSAVGYRHPLQCQPRLGGCRFLLFKNYDADLASHFVDQINALGTGCAVAATRFNYSGRDVFEILVYYKEVK